MKWFLIPAFLCLVCFPCRAQKTYILTDIDRGIHLASGIWIIQVDQLIDDGRKNAIVGATYKVSVIQTLKGKSQQEMQVMSMPSLGLKKRYLFFGFGSVDGIPYDNGSNTPVPILDSFSLAQLQGKSTKEQISIMLSAVGSR